MITHFKNALNQIKAEDTLIKSTQEFLITEMSKKKEKTKFKLGVFPMKKLAVLVCSILLLIAGSTGAYAFYQMPVTYLSVDINPSVELGINTFGKVVKVKGYNDDGLKILEGQDIIGTDVKEAVNTLIDSAADNGYILEDGTTVVSLTIETDNDDIVAKMQEEAEEAAKEALEENEKSAEIIKEKTSLSLREEAEQYEITPGKLNLIKKLQEVDSTVKVEDYTDASVKEIMWQMKKDNGVRDEDKKPNEELDNQDETEDNEESEIEDENSDKTNEEKNKNENKNQEKNKDTNIEQNEPELNDNEEEEEEIKDNDEDKTEDTEDNDEEDEIKDKQENNNSDKSKNNSKGKK
jgi:hypothetical protein